MRRWCTAGAWLLAFWLVAVLWLAPVLERLVAAAARAVIQELTTGYAAPQVEVSGQQLRIQGQVRTETQRRALVEALRTGVRVPSWTSLDFNPVTAVDDAMQEVPYPSGWLFIAAHGARGRLIGQAASDAEAHDLSTLLGRVWSAAGGYLDPQVEAVKDLHDEATDVEVTLTQPPIPRWNAGADSAQAQIARIGGPWQRLIIDAADDVLKTQILAMGIDKLAWEKLLLPELGHLRRYQKEQRKIAEEAERQSRLPPPHVFVAHREGRMLVRGEVASLTLKRELLNALIDAFPERRVLDDLRVNAERRSVGDLGALKALMPRQESAALKEKSLHLGLPSAAWQSLDVQVGAETEPWKSLLPKDLPPGLLAEDGRMVLDWLQGGSKGIPKLPARLQPSFLTLTLLPQKVILAGQVAEENIRTQLLEAARQKYAGRAVILGDALLARGTCEQPAGNIQETLRSFPDLPRSSSRGIIAFARPGAIWNTCAASSQIFQPGAIASTGILPPDFPAAMAEDSFLDSFDHLRHHWKTLTTQEQQATDR